jgi:hypothetical protein
MPVGPIVIKDRRFVDSLRQAERGTSFCRLEGERNEPNAYDYNQNIANA